MSGFLPIFKRELFSFFVTPLAWVVMTAFLVIQGLHFYVVLTNFATQVALNADAGPVQTFFGQTVFLYIPIFFVCPVLTMRLFAEERRSGTLEPLKPSDKKVDLSSIKGPGLKAPSQNATILSAKPEKQARQFTLANC